jgi:hypothetical protein
MFKSLLAKLRIFTLLIAIFMVVFMPDVAAETIEAGSTDEVIRLDGILDEPAWQQAGVIADLTQQDPVPGGATPFTTEVRILVDSSGLYIAFTCHDPEPSRIAIHTMQRDGDQSHDDSVAVVLDPTTEGWGAWLALAHCARAWVCPSLRTDCCATKEITITTSNHSGAKLGETWPGTLPVISPVS